MKHFWTGMILMILSALLLVGCGTGKASEKDKPAEKMDEIPSETVKEQEEPAPDTTNLTYLEEYQIKNVLGDGEEYSLYAPKGGKIMEEWFFTFDGHGVSFSASVFPGGSVESLQEYLKDQASLTVESWQEDPECSDIHVGEMLEKGDDRYLFVSVKNTDRDGVAYQRAELHYLSVRDKDNGVGVFLEMGVDEMGRDEETAALIDDVARCYGLDLSEFAMEDGTWAEQTEQQTKQRQADFQDVYEPKEGEPVLEKVDGYQYLGRTTLIFEEEAGITYPVLVPMGWNTSISNSMAAAVIHGVSVRAKVDHSRLELQEEAQQTANEEQEYYSDPEKGNRNMQIGEIMPMQGQESGVFYVLEYEEQINGAEEYHRRADITMMIPVEEPYYLTYKISLASGMYDSATNSLIRELETRRMAPGCIRMRTAAA